MAGNTKTRNVMSQSTLCSKAGDDVLSVCGASCKELMREAGGEWQTICEHQQSFFVCFHMCRMRTIPALTA